MIINQFVCVNYTLLIATQIAICDETLSLSFFSGVIFALKVLTSENQDSGMKYAVWTELVLIYLLVPGSSFMGHLAGILAGLTFSKTRIGKFLKALIEKCTGNLFISNLKCDQLILLISR